MNALLLAILVAHTNAAGGVTYSSTLELETPLCKQQYSAPQIESGDIVQIGDFQYVVMKPSDYQRLWVEVCALKKSFNQMNSNENGRVALHGRRGHTTITNDTWRTEYADGYMYIETIHKNKKPMNARPVSANKKKATDKIPSFRKDIIRKRREALAKTNEVTVVVGM